MDVSVPENEWFPMTVETIACVCAWDVVECDGVVCVCFHQAISVCAVLWWCGGTKCVR